MLRRLMTEFGGYRSPAVPLTYTEDWILRVRGVLLHPEVVAAIERRGLSGLEMADFLQHVRQSRRVLGDALWECWQHVCGVGRCPVCACEHWSTKPPYDDATRICRACSHEWVPMRFDEEDFIVGRVQHRVETAAEET